MIRPNRFPTPIAERAVVALAATTWAKGSLASDRTLQARESLERWLAGHPLPVRTVGLDVCWLEHLAKNAGIPR